MDRVAIQARIDAGLATAASRLGASYQVYRPLTAMTPLAGAAFSLQAAVARDAGLQMRAPAGYGDALRFLLGDSSRLRRGDVLVGDGTTLFVASIDPLLPAMLVDCNTTVQVITLAVQPGYGNAAEAVLAAGWPASLRLTGRGEATAAGLPGDMRPASFQLLLPAIPAVNLAYGMRIVDGTGRRLTIAGVELTALGYRILASYGGS